MAVYPDLFSLIRREWHILESLEDKKISYKAIKNKLISIINEIDRNQKCYGASVRNQVDGIIKEIDAATSAKVVAQKIYHLYAVHGKHSEQDKKRLRAAVRQFTMRISQIIGIASNVQLHSLTLEDVLEDQQSELEMFHAKVKGAIPYGETISLSEYEKFLFAFENYFTYKSEYLKEPFRTFDAQISRVFGTVEDMRKQNAELVMKKADLIISLQRRFLDAYILEHTYKE